MAKVTRIDQVREILLGEGYTELVSLRERIARPERRTDDVAEVLPASIAASHGRDERLIDALRDPLRQCMASSVREEPERFANALFPIMGPAIRRAVAQALKDWAQQFNQALEHSLSWRGLMWRYQAWRAGIPFGQYVLQSTLLYRAEHIYLIQARTGRLVRHLHQADAALRDDDAVSAMFTAIQEFIRDAFSGDYTQRLRTAELGELTLWAVHGPSGVLVTVIRGVPPASLRATLEEVMESIDTGFGDLLSGWTGEERVPQDIEIQLARCLSLSATVEEKPPASVWRGPVAVVLLLIVALSLYLAVAGLLEARRIDELRRALDGTPGLVVSELVAEGDRIIVRGMRDPLAPTAASVASRHGWDGDIDASWTSFLSLEPDLVLRRARGILEPPSGVELGLVGDTLEVTGTAAADWRERALARSLALPGVRELDLSGLRTDPERPLGSRTDPELPSGSRTDPQLSLDVLRRILRPPPDVEIDLNGNRVELRGQAPQHWLDGVPDKAAGLPGLEALDLDGVVAAERLRMADIAEEVGAATIRFGEGTRLDSVQTQGLAAIATLLREYDTLANVYGEEPLLSVTGHTDDTGSRSTNIPLERERAMTVTEGLRVQGLPRIEVRTRSDLVTGGGAQRFRGVTFELGVRPADPQ